MYSEEYVHKKERELKLLREEWKDLSKKKKEKMKEIHKIEMFISSYKNRKENSWENTPCFKRYGKRFKDLTLEERRDWSNFRAKRCYHKKDTGSRNDK